MVKSNIVMTEGSIWKKIILFAIPLFLGNLFQQLYNLSDSFIVSKMAGENAFASITTTGSFTFFLVGFFNGTASGAGVVIARYIGAKDHENVKKAVHTDIAFGLVASACVTVIGVVISPFLLKWLRVDDALYHDSLVYVSIYFAGSSTIIMYNICMGIMQASGDSRHPLYYLILSSFVNVGLDLLFVGVFQWSVAGAAVATVIAQGLSAGLCLFRLHRVDDDIRLYFRQIKFDKQMIKQILKIGLPAGVQNSIISIANMVVQSNINSFGSAATTGCGSYSRIEGFAFLPVTCFTMAITTFTGQNLGAQNYKRAKKGAIFGILCSITLAEVIGVIIWAFAPSFISIFASSEEAIAFGVKQARTVSLFYCLLAYSHCASAVLRGAGKSILPMLTMFICWCGIRIAYVTITLMFINDIGVVFWAYPLTWSLSSIFLTCFLIFSNWVHGLEPKQKKMKRQESKIIDNIQ